MSHLLFSFKVWAFFSSFFLSRPDLVVPTFFCHTSQQVITWVGFSFRSGVEARSAITVAEVLGAFYRGPLAEVEHVAYCTEVGERAAGRSVRGTIVFPFLVMLRPVPPSLF